MLIGGQAIEAAKSLRAELLSKYGIEVSRRPEYGPEYGQALLCEVPEGQNIKEVVVDGLDGCELAVLLGTKTYGTKTVSFSTYEEMEFVIAEGKPFFLVKMC